VRSLVGFLDGPDLELVRRHVPGLDPARVWVGTLPAWWRRLIGLDVVAVAYGPVILLEPGVHRLDRCRRVALIAHEATHVRQQAAGPFGFAVAYAVTYLVGRLGGSSHAQAYRSIPAERLAREVQARVLAACR